MSGCTYTVPSSVRTIDPVGHASRHPAFSQCLHTSEMNCPDSRSPEVPPMPGCAVISTKATCRQVEWPRRTVLSYDRPLHSNPSAGTWLYSLHATSHALHPMHRVESVRNALVGTMLSSHQGVEIVERGAAARTPSRRDVTDQSLAFHDPDVGLFGNGDEIVGRVAGDQALRAPVVRQANLVQHAPVDPQRRHPLRHQRARFDHAARRG